MPPPSKATRSMLVEHWEQDTTLPPTARGNIKIQLEKYLKADVTGDAPWTRDADVPTELELGWIQDGQPLRTNLSIPKAKILGAYDSKDHYLSTQYRLMRTDGIYPLAKCVDDYRQGIQPAESNDYKLYEDVFITSTRIARDGLALQLEFSATAIGATIHWAKSKRLRSGGLIAITPADDKFNTHCIPAIIASRLMANLDVLTPLKPSIFVFVGHAHQIEIDPQKKWIMMECTQGYWEAYRHTLRALQQVRLESFPMEEYIVNVQTQVEAPEYRQKNPIMNVSDAAHTDTDLLKRMDVFQEWPEFQEVGAPMKDRTKITSDLDNSQLDALKRILTKKLAIVQGPPGTGKTFTSVAAIKILLNNMTRSDPPIIIAAQTNHAVDQILRYISKFEPAFIRLGGQTTDHEIIKPRTLYELRGEKPPVASSATRSAQNIRRSIGNELEKLLMPLTIDEPISAEMFFEHGILSEAQRDSIKRAQSPWSADQGAPKMNIWCEQGLTKITNEDRNRSWAAPIDEYENLDEQEIEAADNDDDKFEHLNGRSFVFSAGYKGTVTASTSIDDQQIIKMLDKYEDLQKIPTEHRTAVYDYLRRQCTNKILERVRVLGKESQEAAIDAKIGRWEVDYDIVSSARIIGLTTTGLSKYRGLLSLLRPKIVLIEEAAETLEPYTAAAVFPTLEHLILIGDHQQLRANCSCADLVKVNFDISLFERLVKNEVEYTRLNTQRRMRPEIRALIKHIYPDLKDHSSVMDRPSIGGLDGHNVHFFHHEYEESVDESKSKVNDFEARVILEFAKYLLWNNVGLDKITVLTFYNGQRKLIHEYFRRHKLFAGHRVKVCTVDSYQGEENDVVLLSLVRNNYQDNIGFLASVNRVCVALSRARIGFYIFGNARNLLVSDHWSNVVDELRAQKAVKRYLPLYCPAHEMPVDAAGYTDLEQLCGGCDSDCHKDLPCGHLCPIKCHPARECLVEDCEEPCRKILPCGHTCSAGCSRSCQCQPCDDEARKNGLVYHFERIDCNQASADWPIDGDLLTNSDPTPAESAANAVATGREGRAGRGSQGTRGRFDSRSGQAARTARANDRLINRMQDTTISGSNHSTRRVRTSQYIWSGHGPSTWKELPDAQGSLI